MKNSGYLVIFFLVFIIIIIPSVVVKSCEPFDLKSPDWQKEQREIENGLNIAVYIDSTKKIEIMSLEQYVKGVVAAEMPASFHIEALKAQAVAARTYAYKRMKVKGGAGCSKHPEADICNDPKHCQAWITKAEMLKKWGIFAYYHYYSKIEQAVNSTSGQIILYQGKPIDPLYFSTSNGWTENSEDVWEEKIPYLRSVESPGEENSPRYKDVKQFPVEVVVSKLKQKWPDILIDSANPLSQWKIVEISDGGRIKTLQIGDKTLKGKDLRELLGLNSTDFRWEMSGNNIKISTIGFGHGVGMSQYGANAMAKKGAEYIDILKHYYKNVEIDNIYGKR